MGEQGSDYDVVVAGASIAGCTAAILFGQAGLKVALVERSRDPHAYKAMCGHWILGGAKPTLERTGLWDAMVHAGASVAWASLWSGEGWVDLRVDGVPPAIALRRLTLDPLLRRAAAATPGVDLMLGAPVTGLHRDDAGRVCGVEVNGCDVVRAALVVGADGHRSTVARLAGVAESVAPNERFFWWTYYRGLELASGRDAQIWPGEPDSAVIVPAGEGLHLVGAFPSKARLAEFASDRESAVARYVSAQPDAPDLRGAERVSRAAGTSDYPFVRRDPLPVPGLALTGDAAMASDPTPAVGCGWAFRSAEWLVDAALPGLRGEASLDASLEGYRQAREIAERYDELARVDAAHPAPNEAARAMRRAALHDPDVARRIGLFAARVVDPALLARQPAPAPVG